MTSAPKFEYTWSVGNLLTLIAMFIGGVAVYTDMQSSLRLHAAAIEQSQLNVGELRETAIQTEARTRALELNNSRIDEKLVSINASLLRIEQALTKREEGR